MTKIAYCVAMMVLTCGLALGQAQYKVIWNFAGGRDDGSRPLANLVMDEAGNLYGTTAFGGNGSRPPCDQGCGTVFKLSPNGDGTWTNTIIYNFCSDFSQSGCLDGQFPQAGLMFDAKGNLYGTTTNGGGQPCPHDSRGCGTVFKLTPSQRPDGNWTETVLYAFCATFENNRCVDGAMPVSQVTLDASGNVYGTASVGGSGHVTFGTTGGLVFELVPGQGGWSEKVLYNFCSLGSGEACPDGNQPMAGVTLDKKGNLYGTTYLGGSPDFSGGGTLYKLTPGQGGWTESVLLAGRGPSGAGPLGMVSLDPLGNIFSTFSAGGQSGVGGAFRYVPGVGRNLFWFDGSNGNRPYAGVFLDVKNAALYGTTFVGGTSNGGTVFKIVAPREETVLYSFCSQPNCADGVGPAAGLVKDKAGNLYGTTKLGGANNLGVVFQITPAADQKPKARPTSIRALLAENSSK